MATPIVNPQVSRAEKLSDDDFDAIEDRLFMARAIADCIHYLPNLGNEAQIAGIQGAVRAIGLLVRQAIDVMEGH